VTDGQQYLSRCNVDTHSPCLYEAVVPCDSAEDSIALVISIIRVSTALIPDCIEYITVWRHPYLGLSLGRSILSLVLSQPVPNLDDITGIVSITVFVYRLEVGVEILTFVLAVCVV